MFTYFRHSILVPTERMQSSDLLSSSPRRLFLSDFCAPTVHQTPHIRRRFLECWGRTPTSFRHFRVCRHNNSGFQRSQDFRPDISICEPESDGRLRSSSSDISLLRCAEFWFVLLSLDSNRILLDCVLVPVFVRSNPACSALQTGIAAPADLIREIAWAGG